VTQTAVDTHPVADRPLHVTTSLCKACKQGIEARVVERAGSVWMLKSCAEHGDQDIEISNNAEWYERTRAVATPKSPPKKAFKEIELGCPFDCGSCAAHEQKVRLPVVTITSACNLDCPICYVHNKNDNPFHMTKDEFSKILAHLNEAHDGDIDVVNLTGGDPTLHPEYLEFIQMARDAGVHRVSICTNGIVFYENEELVKKLAELDARIALSFDSFETDADFAMQGAHLVDIKLAVMDLLEKHDVDTTLIPVMTKGLNDHEIGKIIQYAMTKTNVRHLEAHTITYTGQSGISFPRDGRISMYEVLERIEETTDGLLRPDDWVSSPCAHPLCYQIAYLLIDPEGGQPVPFTRFLEPATLYDCLSDRLYIEPTAKLELALQEAIDRLWAEGDDDSERILRILKNLLGEMFPTDRPITAEEALRVSERACKAIYLHSHMDEETFDTERLVQCCDSNCYADGSTIPVCAYNVIYRETEAHFMLEPKPKVVRRGGAMFPIID
jgi:hypothetical protein